VRVGGVIVAAARPVVLAVARPPLVGSPLWPEVWLRRLAETGRTYRRDAARRLRRVLRRLAPIIVAEVLDQLDLTQLILDRVDIDRLVARANADAIADRLDLDAIVDRVPIDRVIERVDVAGLANYVVSVIDLPAIIERSTGSLAAQAARDVRIRGIEADEMVMSLLRRVLHPRHPRPGLASSWPGRWRRSRAREPGDTGPEPGQAPP